MTPPIPTEKADMNANTVNDGGPAFGHSASYYGECPQKHHGMTLRDYFAAAALTGICAAPVEDLNPSSEWEMPTLARDAYRAADAMIAARAALAKASGAQ